LRSVRVSAAALHPFPLGIESMSTNVSQQNDRRNERVGSTGSRRLGTISGERDRRATACSEDDSTSSADHRRPDWLRGVAMLGDAIVHVVDDDDLMRHSIDALLRSVGYTVKLYGRAEDFLAADPADVPGCVIIDVRMPGPSGLELQASLAQR